MTRHFSIPALVLTIALAAAPAQAEVKKEERNQVTFGGVPSGVFKLFGGKGLKDAFARLSREDFGGTAIQTTVTMDAVKSAEQLAQETKEEAKPSGGGISGRLGGMLAKKIEGPVGERQ